MTIFGPAPLDPAEMAAAQALFSPPPADGMLPPQAHPGSPQATPRWGPGLSSVLFGPEPVTPIDAQHVGEPAPDLGSAEAQREFEDSDFAKAHREAAAQGHRDAIGQAPETAKNPKGKRSPS